MQPKRSWRILRALGGYKLLIAKGAKVRKAREANLGLKIGHAEHEGHLTNSPCPPLAQGSYVKAKRTRSRIGGCVKNKNTSTGFGLGSSR